MAAIRQQVKHRFADLGIDAFAEACLAAGLCDIPTARDEAQRVIRHLRSNAAGRAENNATRRLEKLWYDALALGVPHYGVYDGFDYVVEAWACWWVYSRDYLTRIQKLRNNLRVVDDIGPVARVYDVGCGVGFSTAALLRIFPEAEVIGTNLRGSKQWDVASLMAADYGFGLAEKITGPADLVFASEYFEHFDAPVAHLLTVLAQAQPRALLFANAFTSRAVGHFDWYVVDGQRIAGSQAQRRFREALRDHGYEKVDARLWNDRPQYWRKHA